MSYDHWKTTEPEPCTEEAREKGCTCRLESVNSASLEMPEPIVDEWCPVHGRDPDQAYEEYRDRQMERDQ